MQNLLLVEDEKDLRESLKETLEDSQRYQVMEATGGVEALDLIKKHQFDIVLFDILMPEGDGINLVIESKKLTNTPKLVAMSGGSYFDASSILNMTEALGAHNIIKKPFNSTQLLTVLNSV